ncbi:MAG: Glu-tRNA(Gln) amidotransferase subunit GatE [Candidatus Anstonellaceae archaeon]
MKCGIEIHQRIAGKKLFCGCPQPPEEKQHEEVLSFSRKLYPVLSELGEADAAAQMEALRQKTMHYKAPKKHSCLVEADEEPPAWMDTEALKAVLVFCKLLESSIVDEIHTMRKTVIDGSNTSGFQRTAVVGLGGHIQTSFGKVGIQSICIEEESAGIIDVAEFDLSRLGIPLVEIATEPVFEDGKQAQEAALEIGSLLRKTGLVQRGIGTIRQDLNISVPQGARVEIKGVQEISMVATTIEIEVQRQQRLLEIASQLKSRLQGSSIPQEFVDLTEIFKETNSSLVGKALKSGGRIFGLRLPQHAGLLGRQVAPNRRYGTELADYARAVGVKGLMHSDEDLLEYGISDDEILETKTALSVKGEDAFVLCFGEPQKVKAALSQVLDRASFLGVPAETRRANPDGTSSFLRPLPGRARMYPETDIPPIKLTESLLLRVQQEVKKLMQAKRDLSELLSTLNQELASQLSQQRGLISHNPDFPSTFSTPELSVFAAAVKEGTDPSFVASTLTNTLQSLKREGVETRKLDEPKLLSFFTAFRQGVFAKAAGAEILRHMCIHGSTPAKAAEELQLKKITGVQLKQLIQQEGLDFKRLMEKYRLKVDAAEAQLLFKKS